MGPDNFCSSQVWCAGVTESVLSDRMGALQLSDIQTNIRLLLPLDIVGQQVADRLAGLLAQLQARHDVEDLLITRQGWYERASRRGLDCFRPNAEDSWKEGEGSGFEPSFHHF